jgi:hypothetical protein
MGLIRKTNSRAATYSGLASPPVSVCVGMGGTAGDAPHQRGGGKYYSFISGLQLAIILHN